MCNLVDFRCVISLQDPAVDAKLVSIRPDANFQYSGPPLHLIHSLTIHLVKVSDLCLYWLI